MQRTHKRVRPGRNVTKRKVKNYDDRPSFSYASMAMFPWRNNPPFIRMYHVPAMQRDSRLSLAMSVLKGMALSLSRFYVKDEDGDEEIRQFVIRQVERFWTVGAAHMIDSMDWGWAGGEVMYRYNGNGELDFNCFQKFRAMDIAPVTLEGDFAGIELKVRNNKFLGGQYAFWTVHDREFNRWWGRSKYESAFLPWFEKHDRHGALDARRAYYYRHSFQGEIGRFPEGSYIDEHGQEVSNRDTMMALQQNARSGGSFTLSSARDEQGNFLWDIEDRAKTQTSHDVREYIEDLDRESTEGLGVSDELFRAADTGSGFSGRKIPEQAVRGILSQVVFWMVYDFDEQVIRPLVRQNYNVDPTHEIIPFGLIDEDQAVEQEEGGRVPEETKETFRQDPKLRVA